MKNSAYILFTVLILLGSCKSYNKTIYTQTKKISRNKLLKQLNKHTFSAHTLDSRISISYQDTNQQISGNGRLRILKDSIIWGSINFLGIPMVKFYITPKRIQYYNKLDQTYYDGNFELLQQQFGVPVNFTNLQNLLTGDMLIKPEPENIHLSIIPQYYDLSVKNRYLTHARISPFYKVLSESLYGSKQDSLHVKYTDYQSFKRENLPKKIQIRAAGKTLMIHLKNISLDKTLKFPFKLPSSYKALIF